MDTQAIWKPKIPFWNIEIDSFFAQKKVNTSPGYRMDGEHAHQHYEILFNYSAIPIRHTVCGRAYESNTTYILYRAPYILHSSNTLTDQPYTRYQVLFRPSVLAEYGGICDLGRLRGRWECLIPASREDLMRLEPILARMRSAWQKEVPRHFWISLLAGLLYEISELVPADLPPEADAPSYIQELMHYAVDHIGEDLGLDTMAEKFFVSRSKLNSDFHAAAHISLHEYVTAIRVSRAKIWLTEGMPLPLIAQKCGFARDSAFIHMFRRETGMTPGEWRREQER